MVWLDREEAKASIGYSRVGWPIPLRPPAKVVWPVNDSESGFCSCSWTELSVLPRRRTGRRLAGHKLVGHPEQVSQHIAMDARQANKHGVIAHVVVRHVVNLGVRNKQL